MKEKRAKIELTAVTVFLLLFAVFFLLKLNGFFDVSSRFHIKEITATREAYSVQEMLDNEPETVWGDSVLWEEPLAESGDEIAFSFTKTVTITTVSMLGTIPDDLHFLQKTGDEWEELSVASIETEEDGTVRYRFSEPAETEYLTIRLGDDAADRHWVIAEIAFGEEDER